MTREKAYKKWIKEADQDMWGYNDLWNAACEWQKEKDQFICTSNHPNGTSKFGTIGKEIADAIKYQDD